MQIAITARPLCNWRRLIGALVAMTGRHWLFVLRRTDNLNFRELHDRWYGEPKAGDAVDLYLLAVVGSSSTGSPAFDTGSWPTGVTKNVHNSGRIAGRGGNGGVGGSELGGGGGSVGATAGVEGGLALRITTPINLNNIGGVIAAGGGGGGGGGAAVGTLGGAPVAAGGGGGGGGAGRDVGLSGAAGSPPLGSPGTPGTLEEGGVGGVGATADSAISGNGGAGGNPGQPGVVGQDGSGTLASRPGAAGGAAGAAIEGIADITFIDSNGDPTENQGTITGATS
jgi:hypothetical protein